jgi:hypothetical protein
MTDTENDRTAVRFAFVLRELQQAQRPFDVHFVRGDRRNSDRVESSAAR